jgi:hypothetical protein
LLEPAETGKKLDFNVEIKFNCIISGMQLVAVLGRKTLGFATTMARSSSMVAQRWMVAESAGIQVTRKMSMFKIVMVMVYKQEMRFYEF